MKNTVADKNYHGLAEKMLFSELGVALNKDDKEIHKLIVLAVEKANHS